MMFSMFLIWIVVLVGAALHKRWTIPLTIANFAWTLVLLKMHMTDPIPLNF